MKIEAGLGPTIIKLKAEDLIRSNYLVIPLFEFIEFPATSISGKTFAQIYRNGIVMNEQRNLAIA